MVILFILYDVKGFLILVICDNDLVIFLEYMKLYCFFCEEVLEGEYIVEIGKVVVCCEGMDVFIIIYGVMV